jgi:hypothetical protein
MYPHDTGTVSWGLSRLNLYAQLFLGGYYFEPAHGQCAAYFLPQFYGPLLFVFAVCVNHPEFDASWTGSRALFG